MPTCLNRGMSKNHPWLRSASHVKFREDVKCKWKHALAKNIYNCAKHVYHNKTKSKNYFYSGKYTVS